MRDDSISVAQRDLTTGQVTYARLPIVYPPRTHGAPRSGPPTARRVPRPPSGPTGRPGPGNRPYPPGRPHPGPGGFRPVGPLGGPLPGMPLGRVVVDRPELVVGRGRRVLRKLREWQRRYLLAEISGTVCAISVGLATAAWTSSLATAALAASLAETVGFYAVIMRQTVPPLYRRHRGHRKLRRIWLTGKASAVEAFDYVVAETADTLVVRPGLIYLTSTSLDSHLIVGLALGKIAADIGYYSVVIPCYELRKKVTRTPEPAPASPLPAVARSPG